MAFQERRGRTASRLPRTGPRVGNPSTPEDTTQEREEAKAISAIATCERRAATARSSLWQNELLRDAVISHLPEDRFETLAWLLGVVILGVALKGVFEFGQEWLVGSVTHRTLFDLRNRFFRRIVQQDLRQLQEAGGTPGRDVAPDE